MNWIGLILVWTQQVKISFQLSIVFCFLLSISLSENYCYADKRNETVGELILCISKQVISCQIWIKGCWHHATTLEVLLLSLRRRRRVYSLSLETIFIFLKQKNLYENKLLNLSSRKTDLRWKNSPMRTKKQPMNSILAYLLFKKKKIKFHSLIMYTILREFFILVEVSFLQDHLTSPPVMMYVL